MATRKLTESDIIERGRELAHIVIQLAEVKGEWTVIRGQYQQRIKELEERRNDLAIAVTTGEERVGDQIEMEV